MFSHKTCTRPSVLFCLLDFEPLVFEGLQSDKEGGPTSQDTSISNSNVGDGHAGPPPTLYPCNKGKSCFFEADPARLFRDFRLPGALALMVASKLSKRQACSNEWEEEPHQSQNHLGCINFSNPNPILQFFGLFARICCHF